MILVDFSQIAYAAIHATTKKGSVDESFLRHLVLSSILHIQRKHSHKYGKDIVLACDNRHCWRVDYFPPYKWERRNNKTKDQLDWNSIHSSLNTIQHEIREHFRYSVINVDGAEGDDVIGVMANHAWTQQQNAGPVEFGGLILESERPSLEVYPTLIVSSDKDYGQLGYISDQYDPRKKVFITSTDPDAALRCLILQGDDSDGVPNILSDDDVFMNKDKKKKTVGKRKMLEWSPLTNDQLKESNPTIARNWERNDTLVNLRNKTPADIASKVIYEYQQQLDKKSNGLMDYFFKNHLHKLMQDIQEFQ